MNIKKFDQFIFENAHESPEEYVRIALSKIKSKIDKYFEESIPSEEDESQVSTMSDALKRGKDKKKKDSKLTLSDMGIELQSSEISKYSSNFDNVKFIFSDQENRYDLYITIPLEDAIPKDNTTDFSDKDIKKCYYKFKKYNIDNSELIGQISKTINIDSIDEEFLSEIKIELDDEFGESEKIEFETE